MKTTLTTVAVSAALLIGTLSMTSGSPSPTPTVPLLTQTTRDGHKDFDLLIGTWRTHYRILRHRLVNSNEWDDCDGSSVVQAFWSGSGNLEVGDLRCPPPRGYIRSMTLRLYDAVSHQWSLYFGTEKSGLGTPPQVGHFDDHGVGDFFCADTFEGKPVIVRYRWILRNGEHPRFEQAFSIDNGKTWETNWTCDYIRLAAPSSI